MDNEYNSTKQLEEPQQVFQQIPANPPKKETSSEEVLAFCAVMWIILSIGIGAYMWIGKEMSLLAVFPYIFGCFTFGVLLYVIAKICRLLVEIRNK